LDKEILAILELTFHNCKKSHAITRWSKVHFGHQPFNNYFLLNIFSLEPANEREELEGMVAGLWTL
jgi:hypothetical protein